MNPIVTIDLTILRFIHTYLTHPILDTIFYWITTLGNSGAIWIGIGLLCLIQKKHRRTGVMVLIALIIGALSSELILKPIIARQRPFVAYTEFITLLNYTKGFSFPSGHTTSSFAAMTVLFRRFEKGQWGFLMLAILIAFSRMYFYVHYPSDVVAGIVLGTLSGIGGLYIGKKIFKD